MGLIELQLIMDADLLAFPPRVPHQPIFYPVLNREYAAQIARQWNARDASAGYAGFVTRFQVERSYVEQFDVHQVGGAIHKELWVPAEGLEAFNQHIMGYIHLVDAYYGEGYSGPEPQTTILKDKTAVEQLRILADCPATDLLLEVDANWPVVYANYLYWHRLSLTEAGLTDNQKRKVLSAIRRAWDQHRPDTPLPSVP